MNNFYFVVISTVFMIYVVGNLKKRELSNSDSVLWVLGGIVMLFLSLFPKTIDFFAKYIGIDYPPSLLFLLCIIFLLLINYRQSRKITKLQEEIITLAQEVAILKERKEK